MQMPQIRRHAPNFTEVQINGVTVWYSYETPVAFRLLGHEPIVCANVWSTTTGKHLNKIDGGDKKNRVSVEEFHRLYAEETRAYVSGE